MQTGQRRVEGDPRESTLASGAPTASWPQYPIPRAGGWAFTTQDTNTGVYVRPGADRRRWRGSRRRETRIVVHCARRAETASGRP
jgi:hypothetical protein